jgi:hypothetical protein
MKGFMKNIFIRKIIIKRKYDISLWIAGLIRNIRFISKKLVEKNFSDITNRLDPYFYSTNATNNRYEKFN